jgi:hypothetical protein
MCCMSCRLQLHTTAVLRYMPLFLSASSLSLLFFCFRLSSSLLSSPFLLGHIHSARVLVLRTARALLMSRGNGKSKGLECGTMSPSEYWPLPVLLTRSFQFHHGVFGLARLRDCERWRTPSKQFPTQELRAPRAMYFMYPVLLYSNLTVPGKICYSLRSAMSYYTSCYARRYAPLPYFTYDTWYGIFPSVDLPRPFDSLTISRPETLVLQPRPRHGRQLRPPPFQSLARLPVGRVEGPYRRGAEGTSSG